MVDIKRYDAWHLGDGVWELNNGRGEYIGRFAGATSIFRYLMTLGLKWEVYFKPLPDVEDCAMCIDPMGVRGIDGSIFYQGGLTVYED